MARRNSLKDDWKFDADLSNVHEISIDSITLPSNQPRRYFDPQKLQQLKESICTHGILEPLLVRPLEKIGQYELVAGERRYRAAKEAGLPLVPVTVRELTDAEAVQLALVENLQREDLNPVEETEGILQLLSLKLQIDVAEVTSLLYRMRNEVVGNTNQNVL
ncbi:ParB/RepB/Spo0J family partition protein, partial [Nostoc sp. CALU 546]